MPARGNDPVDRRYPQPRHAIEQFARGTIDVERESLPELERPGQLGIDVQRQVALVVGRLRHLRRPEAVETDQPVGLVEAMFAHQRRSLEGEDRAGIGDGTERGVIDPPQPELRVEPARPAHDIGIARPVGTDDHLRGLAGRGEPRRMAEPPARIPGRRDVGAGAVHRAFDLPRVLVGGEPRKAAIGRQFDIDRDAISEQARPVHELGIGLGNGLEVDVAPELVLLAQDARAFDHLLHRVVGAFHDAGRKEQPLDIVAAIEADRQVGHFLRGEARPARVAALAIDAVMTIENAVIGQQDLEQGDTPAVGGIGMADPHPLGRTDPLPAQRIAPGRSGRRARGVVLGRIGKNGEPIHDRATGHMFSICSPRGRVQSNRTA